MTERAGARRSSATVRALVLAAARELFEQRGYEPVSTREIADRAGVTQAAVFRHFGTKADLFVEAVGQPLYAFITDYLRRWLEGGHASDTSEHDTEAFVAGLYRLLLDNRPLLTALAGGLGDAPETIRSPFLHEILDRLEKEVEVETRIKGGQTMDVRFAVRFTFALVYGVALLDDALFADDAARPDHAAIVAQLSGFILRGSTQPGR